LILLVVVFLLTIALLILSLLVPIAAESNKSAGSSNSATKLPQLRDDNLTVEVVASGLNMPTTMAFLGNDDFLILQKNGSLVRIVDGLLSNKTRLDIPVASGFYQGLLGIAISNQSAAYDNNTYVFLYYTEVGNRNTSSNEKSTGDSTRYILGNRVYRYDFIDDKLSNPKLLLDLPANSIENHGALQLSQMIICTSWLVK
jgi:aldose sugar dehydrogenase